MNVSTILYTITGPNTLACLGDSSRAMLGIRLIIIYCIALPIILVRPCNNAYKHKYII